MSLYIPILSEVVGGVRDWFKGRQEIKQAQVEGEIAITRKAAEHVETWEQLHAKGSQTSWKDEFWTLVFATPMILGFIPGGKKYVDAGFEALEAMPQWYQYTLMVMVLAAFGIRLTGTVWDKLGIKRKTQND